MDQEYGAGFSETPFTGGTLCCESVCGRVEQSRALQWRYPTATGRSCLQGERRRRSHGPNPPPVGVFAETSDQPEEGNMNKGLFGEAFLAIARSSPVKQTCGEFLSLIESDKHDIGIAFKILFAPCFAWKALIRGTDGPVSGTAVVLMRSPPMLACPPCGPCVPPLVDFSF